MKHWTLRAINQACVFAVRQMVYLASIAAAASVALKWKGFPGMSRNSDHRGFDNHGVVHFVHADEWLYYHPLCVTDINDVQQRKKARLEEVKLSQAAVTCLECLAMQKHRDD